MTKNNILARAAGDDDNVDVVDLVDGRAPAPVSLWRRASAALLSQVHAGQLPPAVDHRRLHRTVSLLAHRLRRYRSSIDTSTTVSILNSAS